MEKNSLIFEFADSHETFEFQKGFSYVENDKLSDTLRCEYYKNFDSTLVIKNLNNIKINDVFQIKINIKYIGYFLVNFLFEKDAKEKYHPLIEEIELLKETEHEEKDKQLLKIEKVIAILNKYNPIYSIFIGKGDVFSYLKECNKVAPLFPLLFPKIVEKVSVEIVKKRKEKKKFDSKLLLKIKSFFDIEKPFFKTDYLFDLLFSFFTSFSSYTAVAFFYKDDLKGLIFVAQILFYSFCLFYSLYLFKYKDKREKHKGEDIIISTYILVGVALGNFISYVVTTFLLNMTDIPLLIVPFILSFVICLSVLPLLKLIYNLIQKKKLK